MSLYYIVVEYDSPKAVFETRRQAEEFIDDRPGREIEEVVSMETVVEAANSFSKQNSGGKE